MAKELKKYAYKSSKYLIQFSILNLSLYKLSLRIYILSLSL